MPSCAAAKKTIKALGIPVLGMMWGAAMVPAYPQSLGAQGRASPETPPSYEDHFGGMGDLAHYEHFQVMTTDVGVTCFSISKNELLITPTKHGKSSDLFYLKNSIMPRDSMNYSVECDIKLDHDVDNLYAGGAFGIVFWGTHSGFSRQFFAFMWSGGYGNFGGWSVVVSDISPFNGVFSPKPAYIPGHWVRLKALCYKGDYKCYLDQHDGKGEQLICAGTRPVGAGKDFGSAGMIGYCGNPGVKDPLPSNHVHFKNFKVQPLFHAPPVWVSTKN